MTHIDDNELANISGAGGNQEVQPEFSHDPDLMPEQKADPPSGTNPPDDDGLVGEGTTGGGYQQVHM